MQGVRLEESLGRRMFKLRSLNSEVEGHSLQGLRCGVTKKYMMLPVQHVH